ncbi:MAG: asparagine synthase (glutamine-hydrolyzing) [Gammaproteobacteria bacterium]|nr:asparagine synthase (glutamine-hydrolyzing) [Gammaproteobacteria bacterium]
MCGIAGLYCFVANCEDGHTDIVAKMCAIQTHRGPDDTGTESMGRVTIGSNRLSIIDLSAAGHMPMHDPESGAWIVFNGEIYNFAGIREELIARGHGLHSRTDTEVVLHAWLEWGEQCLDRFVGMFAFAIYKPQDQSLVLVRDRFGKKPLYYTQQGSHLLFASELKSLVAVSGQCQVNWQQLMEWSLYRNIDFGPTDTLYAGFSSVPAGHLMEIRDGVVSASRPYYSLESHVTRQEYERLDRLAPDALRREIEALVLTGVEDRLVSDVPVGTLCSGGIDSSLITAVAARGRKDLLAFNVSVTGAGAQDESRFAKQVTDSLGIRLLTLQADGQSFRDNLVRAIYYSDYPLTHPNSVYFLLISEFARSHGVKVLLSGEAADELFGGYAHRYRRYGQYRSLQRLVGYLPARLRRLIVMAGYAAENVAIAEFTGYEGLVSHTTSFIDKFSRMELRERCTSAYDFVGNEVDRGILGGMLADMTNYLAPLLRRLDRMSMGASVECRVPFLDHRLVDTVVNLPLSARLHGKHDKWLLKEIAVQHLPRSIVYRKKLGFPLPLQDYMTPLVQPKFFKDGYCVEQLQLNNRGLNQLVSRWTDNVDGMFSLLALEIWGRLNMRGETVVAVREHLMSLGI